MQTSGEGALVYTGSRSVGAAGRLPLLDVASHRLAAWRKDALNVNRTSCCLATFVDNLATIAETPEQAIRVMNDCEDELLKRWCLRIGPDSKEYMTCRAYPLAISVPSGWERRTTLKCLGHHLQCASLSTQISTLDCCTLQRRPNTSSSVLVCVLLVASGGRGGHTRSRMQQGWTVCNENSLPP